nr:DUF4129 domain-containing protein [Xanthovirga aplysinae]
MHGNLSVQARPFEQQPDINVLKYDTASLNFTPPNTTLLDKYDKDKNFNYAVPAPKPENWWDRLWARVWQTLAEIIFANKLSGIFWRLFIVGLGVAALVLLILHFTHTPINTLFSSKGREKALKYSLEEEHIEQIDWEKLINDALLENNFRLAIRFQFLQLLKVLSSQELIRWSLEKTNDDYLKELQKDTFKASFKQLTYLYEYAWYGNFPLTKETYQTIGNSFEQFKGKLKEVENS